MNLHTFIADSPAEAVSQIREKLGPEAIVLNVRKVPGDGLSRLWRKPKIELVACVPEDPNQNRAADLQELRQELAAIKEHITAQKGFPEPPSGKSVPVAAQQDLPEPDTSLLPVELPSPIPPSHGSQGALDRFVERSGLLPTHTARLLDEVRAGNGHVNHGAGASSPTWVRQDAQKPNFTGFADEWTRAREILKSWWPASAPISSNTHVFIGPAGSGKTTVLCKWMAQAVLMDNRRCRVWRLDGSTANGAESLSIFAEVLGVPLDRIQPETPPEDPSEMLFVDLPGINWRDRDDLLALAQRLRAFPGAQIHLVLNAAYEGHLLLAQARTLGSLPVKDVILTHLDEEQRWGKIWNLVLGTNFSVGYVSAGQNIPGVFGLADPEKILPCNLA